jgi:hypothetical protein
MKENQEKIDAMGLATLRRRPALLTEWRIHSRILQRSVRILVPQAQKIKNPHFCGDFFDFLERAMGLEPTTAAMARRYSSQLSYARKQKYIMDFRKKARKNPEKGFCSVHHTKFIDMTHLLLLLYFN